jgi:dTDP-L-rhamnose 4-epimerase
VLGRRYKYNIMPKLILITGGAGFIGSHVADELLRHGYTVRAFDCLSPQVHGSEPKRPHYLDPAVELIVGDLRDRELVRKALRDVDAVYHLAAKVGVGQSMYQVAEYTAVNNLATAVLMEEVIDRRVERLVVASSMSIYGEGLYRDQRGALRPGTDRNLEQLKRRDWELHDEDGAELAPVPTPESKPPALASVYALSKFDQERMCLTLGRAYGVPTVALRFFNVYGPRQALSNPYTGVLAIFASQLLNGKPPVIFEDGLQQRDFVNVHDIALGCRLALEVPGAGNHVFNIGSGRHTTVREVAERLGHLLDREDIEPEVTGRYRIGDIRHCFADISLARETLGYEPQVSFERGLDELAGWLETQIGVAHAADASAELQQRGLTVREMRREPGKDRADRCSSPAARVLWGPILRIGSSPAATRSLFSTICPGPASSETSPGCVASIPRGSDSCSVTCATLTRSRARCGRRGRYFTSRPKRR